MKLDDGEEVHFLFVLRAMRIGAWTWQLPLISGCTFVYTHMAGVVLVTCHSRILLPPSPCPHSPRAAWLVAAAASMLGNGHCALFS